MSTLEQLYAQAESRRSENRLPYAGALSPAEAFELLQLDPRARLVDVRTRAELDWVGRPVIGDGQYAHVEWTRYPGAESGIPRATGSGGVVRYAGAVPVPQRRALEARRDRRHPGRFYEGVRPAGWLRGRQGRPGASKNSLGVVFSRLAVDRRLTRPRNAITERNHGIQPPAKPLRMRTSVERG
jgi:hypothetical protein